MFERRLIRCQVEKAEQKDRKSTFHCLDDIRRVQDLSRTVFLYSPEYTSQPNTEIQIFPIVAIASNSIDFVPMPRGNATSFLLAGKSLFYEYRAFRSDREKRCALFAAHDQFEKAVRAISSIFYGFNRVVSEEIAEAILLLAECKIEMQNLCSAKATLQMHSRNEHFREQWRYWYLLAVTHRKLFDYRAASFYIHKASRILNDQDIESHSFKENVSAVKKELALLETLRPLRMIIGEDETAESLHEHCRKHFQYTLPKQVAVAPQDKQYYNVLCIDGGGIKVIIACFILAEIERRSGTAIRHLFQHIAGTSTGAIIAGALALPHAKDPNAAKFTAYEVLEMYAIPENAKMIFKRTLHYFGMFGAKYDPNGRAALISKFYGDATFADATVQLTILAANENRGNDTMEFSNKTHPKLRLVDAAMASSAAPTYFPSYKIEKTSYIDGGLSANNPSCFAYTSAQKLCNDKPIRMVSIGCGDVITEFIEHNQGALFYAPEALSQAICAQQLTADYAMAHSQIEEYHRWQPLFEKLTGMDDRSGETLRLYIETAKQYVLSNEEKIERLIASLMEVTIISYMYTRLFTHFKLCFNLLTGMRSTVRVM